MNPSGTRSAPTAASTTPRRRTWERRRIATFMRTPGDEGNRSAESRSSNRAAPRRGPVTTGTAGLGQTVLLRRAGGNPRGGRGPHVEEMPDRRTYAESGPSEIGCFVRVATGTVSPPYETEARKREDNT